MPTEEVDPSGEDTAAVQHPEEAAFAEEVLNAAAALSSQAAAEGAKADVSAEDALRGAMCELGHEPRSGAANASETTKRLVKAICSDDFEETEDAIYQGGDVNVDCGGGLGPLHMASLRGNIKLVELMIAHGARINMRDLSGNTPLLYGVHFWKQHGRGVPITAQLLYHKADPATRVSDGKMAGTSAIDIVEQACKEPQLDENAPRQMRAMLRLAQDSGEAGYEVVTKMWMAHKAQDQSLYQMSGKGKYEYGLRSVDWNVPQGISDAPPSAPVRLGAESGDILGERFVWLKDYSFSDEGEKVKVYVTFPVEAAAELKPDALSVTFEFEGFDLRLRAPSEHYRLHLNPLHGTIDVDQCKHRVSSGSSKVTLTLKKRHVNRHWPHLLKLR